MGAEDKASNKIDDIGGKAKEALGKVTGDKDTENKGKVDQAKSSLKDAGERSRTRSRARRKSARPAVPLKTPLGWRADCYPGNSSAESGEIGAARRSDMPVWKSLRPRAAAGRTLGNASGRDVIPPWRRPDLEPTAPRAASAPRRDLR